LAKTKKDGLAEHLRAVFAALSPAHQETFRRSFEASLASGDSESFFRAILGGLGVTVSQPTPLDFADPDLWPIYANLPPALQVRFYDDFMTATRGTAHTLFARIETESFFDDLAAEKHEEFLADWKRAREN
jgi:hypothetical protein